MLSTCQDNMSKILHYFDIFYVCRCYRHEFYQRLTRSSGDAYADFIPGKAHQVILLKMHKRLDSLKKINYPPSQNPLGSLHFNLVTSNYSTRMGVTEILYMLFHVENRMSRFIDIKN